MSQSSKHQPYTYTLKSVAYARDPASGLGDSVICTNSIIFYPVPPENAITIENLYMHLNMRFYSAIPSAARILRKVGIIDKVTSPALFAFASGYRLKTLDVDIEADADRYIDLRLDLTSLLKKDDVAQRNVFNDSDNPENGYTMIYIEFDSSLKNENVGELHLWKTEALFTTIGIV